MTYRFALIAALAIGLTGPLHAGTAEIAASIADKDRSEENRALDEGRKPAAILAFADFQAGETVADFMAGSGFYTELISRIVGKNGHVYAVEPDVFYDPAKWDVLRKSHRNVSVMPVTPRAMQLAPNSVDALFTHMNFHDLYWESEQYRFPRLDENLILRNWFAAVKPGGKVIVVDHTGPAGEPREVVEKLHRIDPAHVIKKMTEFGFVLEGRSDALHMAGDDHSKNVYDPAIRGKTDRFALKFRKPG